ncbi:MULTISPECIES: NAD(P)-binding domain-containing protein [Parachlamydia]|jgi:cation diffusion facilitator CzcD-associated flavoprotein CzcO|uniref:NAD(P)-binding domain-containing protein n=1 Tax=Parachlamydia TaxID=83551 RepID=UPI0024E2348F|nr:NAD(P)-binding domain-containing protein [Parachlamydia acanthamoebae]
MTISKLYQLFFNQKANRLKKLECQALKELKILDYPPRKNWLPSRKTADGQKIYDVVIVGGGQTAIAVAFSLIREKITNILIFDENDKGCVGPWLTYARMDTLRTPKYTLGPDCDIPSLTFQSWYEAIYGEDAWKEIQFIPRLDWARYLTWLQTFLNLPIVNNAKVGSLRWQQQDNCFFVPVNSNEIQLVYARKIILATGLQGSGGWSVPEHIQRNIPRKYYDQASEVIAFEKFKDKKVGILGAGPCAFDNALKCSEYGAKEVHIFSKKSKLVNLHTFLWGEYVGFLKGFSSLSDEAKFRFISKMYEIGQPPTPDGVKNVRAKNNIFIHFNNPWIDSKMLGNRPVVITPKAEEVFDALIIAIGWTVDLRLRQELNHFRDKIALWSDRMVSTNFKDEMLLRSPYLGKGSNFSEKQPGTAPYLHSIFNCTGGALLSTGFNAGTGLTGMKYSIKSIVDEIVNQLFVDDQDYFYQTLATYDHQIFEN